MQPVKLFPCGDVMTGRGIDQVLRHPCDPRIYEGYVKDARDYVRLAERASGAVPRGVDDAYMWGDALEELARAKPDARIINLETAVTTSDDWLDKGINYPMHPANVGCLVRETEGVGRAVQLMRAHGVRRLPVVDASGALVGLVAADDLLELFGEELSALAAVVARGPRREREERRASGASDRSRPARHGL